MSKAVNALSDGGGQGGPPPGSPMAPVGAVGGSLVRILSAPKLGIVTPKLGLLGGGETSTSTQQTSGWGAPGPSTSASGTPGWGGGGGVGGGAQTSATGAPWGEEQKQSAGAASWAATAGAHNQDKSQLRGATTNQEQDDLRRVAAFSSGWGQTTINQDSAWDAPPSPKEPPPTPQMMAPPPNQMTPPQQPPPGAPMAPSIGAWPAEMKTQTGTEIWECSIRQKGSKAPGGGAASMHQQQQQQPWQPQHTPSTHIGGTWGEEEVENPNSMWTGVPPPNVAPPGMGFDPSQWPPQGPPPDKQWGPQAPPPPQQWATQPPAMPQHDAAASWGGLKEALAYAASGPSGQQQHGWPPGAIKKEWEPSGLPEHSQRPPPVAPYDEGMHMSSGTAVWGNPGMQGKVSHWKDMPAPGAPKVMSHQWAPTDKAQWQQEPKEWGATYKTAGPPDWSDGQIDTSTWGGPAKQGGKPLTKDLIWASKQFRVLTSMGYPKEDVENFLRLHNMDLEQTLMELASRVEPPRKKEIMNRSGFQVSQWEPRGPPPPLQQTQPQQPAAPLGGGACAHSAPSTHQLRELVSQIRAAVHAGYLNPQILNQPLAPQTLQLLYQLLQQIKVLNHLQCKPEPIVTANPIQHSLQMAQTRQRIKNLQNQISASQALYLKQQPPPPSGTESRLSQWKLPSPTGNNAPNDGPQPVKQNLQNNGNKWDNSPTPSGSMGVGGDVSQIPPTSMANSSPPSSANMNSNYNISDIVAEFEPGKPWKGSWNMKSAEDDPHMTPGSVTRSPLVVNPIKDNDQFNSPSDWQQQKHSGRGASEKAWFSPIYKLRASDSGGSSWSTFGPSAAGPSAKKWGESDQLWGNNGPMSASSGGKGFLVLKNLTAQIDGSTLKTLCMQHGPVQLFHLFLSHGFALIQYSSREEALKAEAALNNCVLSNTTILAYVPSDPEVQQLLQLANYKQQPNSQQQQMRDGPQQQQQQQQMREVPPPQRNNAPQQQCGWPSFGAGGGALWGPPEGSANDPTPLNSFLPGDLLSGESM